MENLKLFNLEMIKNKLIKLYQEEKNYHIPNMHAETIINIDIDEIKRNGIKYGLLDLDSTLFPLGRFKECNVLKEFMATFLEEIPSVLVTRSGWTTNIRYIGDAMEEEIPEYKKHRVHKSMDYLGIKEGYLRVKKLGTSGLKNVLNATGFELDKTAVFGNYFVDIYFPNKLGMYTVQLDREPKESDEIKVKCQINKK